MIPILAPSPLSTSSPFSSARLSRTRLQGSRRRPTLAVTARLLGSRGSYSDVTSKTMHQKKMQRPQRHSMGGGGHDTSYMMLSHFSAFRAMFQFFEGEGAPPLLGSKVSQPLLGFDQYSCVTDSTGTCARGIRWMTPTLWLASLSICRNTVPTTARHDSYHIQFKHWVVLARSRHVHHGKIMLMRRGCMGRWRESTPGPLYSTVRLQQAQKKKTCARREGKQWTRLTGSGLRVYSCLRYNT